ncbi:hypothetical protein RJ640_029992 [Escallonia rubra]|uniref:Apoptosis inhibitor 5 n=1 Tax=Escallonia rubra TaxID=112253 RepID=A0AA88U0T3_9ASTE|nr:hypothetical protein RJ640_029992 [Escallonia rubra]
MAEPSDEIEKLYQYGERLNEAKDKSQHVGDYEGIIKAATSPSIKAQQLAAQLIPRFFKFFPGTAVSALDAHFDLCEADELGVSFFVSYVKIRAFLEIIAVGDVPDVMALANILNTELGGGGGALARVGVPEGGVRKTFRTFFCVAFDQENSVSEVVRVQAIRGLPLFCKDTPEHLPKLIDILAQLLSAEENVERDAVQKALLSLLRQDVKASLTALFKHIESVEEPITDESLRERTLTFIKDKVFPLKAELLKPPEEMERHITDLIKKSLQDVTGSEFKMFIDFLKSLGIFGEKAPPERVQELMEMIEGQADLDAQFNVSDMDHVDRLISCLYMALPFFVRGASNSKFLNYLNKQIFPVFDELPEKRKVDLLKNLAESSPYTTPQDARQIFPSVVQLLKKYMPLRKTGEEMNFTYVECLLYTFHHLASKAPNATNSLCGYKIVTGQPSDRLGEDFSENYKDFTERLSCVEELDRATMKKLTQGMAEHNKAMATAKTDEEKATIKTKKQNSTTGLRTCNNILAMTEVGEMSFFSIRNTYA